MYEQEKSKFGQYDGKSSYINNGVNSGHPIPPNTTQPPHVTKPTKQDKIAAAEHLPTVATYNLRSLGPKIKSLGTDILERNVSCAFCQEIWENESDRNLQFEIEKLLELEGLKYISTSRKPNKKGVSHGGAAIIVNLEKFSCEKIQVQIPQNLEVVWGLLRPKSQGAKFKTIIACSFYSPPNKGRNSKLADHIVGTLHMLAVKYPDSAIILGADKNNMDIQPILSCGLRLRQCVDKPTRQGVILDIIIMNTFTFYNSPYIAPPIQPDDPSKGKPSDHSVPVCVPHTDRYHPPTRHYKTVKYRPLPESSLRKFGQWIVTEGWEEVKANLTPSKQIEVFQNIVFDKLNQFCPEKSFRVSSQDKPWVTAELKSLHRSKSREYVKNGKSLKYKELAKLFKRKYKSEAEKYLRKNLDELMECKPGQAYSVLKRMGARPGDCTDSHTFTLPGHEAENLSPAQSAERIAEYFSQISQEFPPLDTSALPQRVLQKLDSSSGAPVVSENDVYKKIKASKKPKAGVPCDLPRDIVREFAPEIALPIQRIINNIVQLGQWPSEWKQEWVSAIGKIPIPISEDDLRPISLTPFFSKVTEHFVVEWLLDYIGDKIDFRQYGGVKGNSVSHYIIEFLNFILLNQDTPDQAAVLACMVDFQKAFNRLNHNLLITKLSDMGVPGWLLKVIMAFLRDRKMVLRYKGEKSSIKYLPGGGPQGTLLGLLLFLVHINDAGFDNQENNAGDLLTSRKKMKIANTIHLKFVDDLTLAEAINLPSTLQYTAPDRRPQPDEYHSRTGHTLPPGDSKLYQQLLRTEEYAKKNQMVINYKKTKLMLFNPCQSMDFMPALEIGGEPLELVDSMRLLGVTVSSDLKWTKNTADIVKRACNKLWILRRLKGLGAQEHELLDMYGKHCRSIIEFAVPVWQSSITVEERQQIERVQKTALHIILGERYQSYRNALEITGLESLETRRRRICLKFARKAENNKKHSKWFKRKPNMITRQKPEKYWNPVARTSRLRNSPICYLTRLLNTHYQN